MVGGGWLRQGDDDAGAAADMIGNDLFLSLRQCATHSAGPLAAVATLVQARAGDLITGDDVEKIEARVRQRVADMTMPEDRRVRVDAFLNAIFTEWAE